MADSMQPAGTLQKFSATRRLSQVTTADLARELLGRLDSLPAQLCGELAVLLDRACDHQDNRFSARRLRGLFKRFHYCNGLPVDVRGRMVVDLGCGGKNPLAMLMIDVLLGARRGIGIDLESARAELALPGMLRAASYMLLDPRLIVGDWPTSREEVARNIGSLDLYSMWGGNAKGLDTERLAFRQESAVPTSLDTGSVDLLYSNSFLEHVANAEEVLAELARVTVPGGWGIHFIDGTDHRRYVEPNTGPLDFLRLAAADGALVRGCNRIRPLQFAELFRRHGFEVVHVGLWDRRRIDAAERATFVEPFRSMPDALLSVAEAVLYLRRR